jgi:hypothetical protein
MATSDEEEEVATFYASLIAARSLLTSSCFSLACFSLPIRALILFL